MQNFYQDIKEALNLHDNLVLVNKNYALPKTYVPNNLVLIKDLPLLVDDDNRYYIKK